MVAGRRAAVEVGCEEVEEERARVGGDAVVLCLWLNVEPVRLRGDYSMRCAASVMGSRLCSGGAGRLAMIRSTVPCGLPKGARRV